MSTLTGTVGTTKSAHASPIIVHGQSEALTSFPVERPASVKNDEEEKMPTDYEVIDDFTLPDHVPRDKAYVVSQCWVTIFS
ncbi:hypothetical protein NCC49_005991 [Naganishia albida]|nr:hypothetical protein NCC49_005991 [Naganishia albida]